MQIITNDIFNLKHDLTKIKLFKQINGNNFFLSLSYFTDEFQCLTHKFHKISHLM